MANNLTVTKTFGWEMAHMLANYKGQCRNLHGHSYKLQVTVMRIHEATTFDMVVDFRDLKKLVNDHIISKYDHAFMYWANTQDEAEKALATAAQKNGLKVYAISCRPTAENMVIQIAADLHTPLEKQGLKLRHLKLWETPSSYAEVDFYE